MRMQICRGRNSRGELTRFIRCCLVKIYYLLDERLKGFIEPEDLLGADDLLGFFRLVRCTLHQPIGHGGEEPASRTNADYLQLG